jgi:hypothetical protein
MSQACDSPKGAPEGRTEKVMAAGQTQADAADAIFRATIETLDRIGNEGTLTAQQRRLG